jgi:iron complex transport system substrate-binding protein
VEKKMRISSSIQFRPGMARWFAFLLTCALALYILGIATAAGASMITSPRGGETLEAGGIQSITWNVQYFDSVDNTVELDYSVDAGVTWATIVQDYPFTQLSYNWNVPDKPTVHARIRVIVSGTRTHEDLTQSVEVVDTDESGDFTISQALALSSPETTTLPEPSPPETPAATITVLINGEALTGDASPYLLNERVMVPFRAVFEALGATVNWDAGQQVVTGSRDQTEVRLTVNSRTAYVNNEAVSLDAALQIVSDRTFVPLRFVGEALGAGVDWDSASSTVSVIWPAASPPLQTAARVTVTDSMGRSVTVPVNPERIVVFNSYAADAICALGAADNIVGAPSTAVTDLANIPLLSQKIANAQNAGSESSPNLAQILSVKPDIMFGPVTQSQSLTSVLQQKGVPVVLLDCSRIDTIGSDLKTMGIILGRQQRAANLISFLDKYRQLVADRIEEIPASQKPRVYWEAADDYTVAGPDTPDGRLLSLLEAKNVTGDLKAPATTLAPNRVIAANPDIIIKAQESASSASSTSGYSSGYMVTSDAMQQQRDLIASRAGWDHINAVANDKIFVLSRTVVDGPQSVIGLLYAAKWLYPDRFQDIDPAGVQAGMLKQYYDLDFNGAWAYPAP